MWMLGGDTDPWLRSDIGTVTVALSSSVLGTFFGIFLNIMLSEVHVASCRLKLGKDIALAIDSRCMKRPEERGKQCMRSGDTNATQKVCTDEAVQSQCTYTYVMNTGKPQFQVLPERSSGVSKTWN